MAQALPPGWEARFDPGSGRYYFINHYTKVTSWVDPRGAVQPQAQPQQPQRQAYAGYSQPAAQPQRQAYSGYSQPAALPAAQRAAQPAAQPSARPARQASPTISRSSAESMPLRSDRREPSPQASSARQETSFGGDDDSGLSEAEKKAMVRKLRDKLDLEGVNDDLVVMTLQGVAYKESMAIDVFRSMGFKGKGEAAAAEASTSSTDRWETTTARPKKTKKKEIKPSQPIRPSPPSQPIPEVSTTDMSSESAITFDSNFDFSLKETSIGSRSVLDHMSADQSADLLSKMTAAADVSSMFSKASSSSFTIPSSSTNKLQEKIGSTGANRGLSRGSDPSLLSNQRMRTRGADRSLIVGPCKGLAQGQSKLAKGQNRGLAIGANRDMSVGRNLTLAKGTQRTPIAV